MLKLLYLLFLSFSLQAQTVYKTPTGSRYHLANCSTVKNASDKITLKEAVKLGLGPCKVCRPQVSSTVPVPLKQAHGKTKATVQCKGMTKAGNRCRRQTSIANGYCFQHVPK